MPKQNTELDTFLESHPDTSHLDVLVIDLCGNAIGKRVPRPAMDTVFGFGTPVCAAMQLVDVLGNTADPMGHGFSDGDPDGFSKPVPGTLTPIPWLPGNRSQVLCQLVDANSREPFWYDPREVLKSVVSRFKDLPYKPVVAAELEFYLLKNQRGTSGEPIPVSSPRTGETENQGKVLSLDKLDEFATFLDAVEKACSIQGIPTTSMISEYGAGQFEINLAHQHDPLVAADHAALLRRAIQGVARSMDYDATFMSKPFADQSGSGFHVHISLENEDGENIFNPALDDADKLLGHAVAGLGQSMSESMAIFAPNLNVYRRFKPDEFVPVTRDWGENNRSVAFRIPPSDARNRRLEHRVSGAEANPYLVIAAVLAGIHYGLSNQLVPDEMASGNAGAQVDEQLPLFPWAAFDALEKGEILGQYMGEKYPALYAEVKRAEFSAFMDAISTREYGWYL